MKITFAGGAMEVGASCIYIHSGGKGVLLDAGIRQSSGKDPLPDFRAIQLQGGVDVILVSHAHMDHIGSLPLISKAYPGAEIYMTAMSMDLCRVLLYDSLKLMGEWEDEIPHYVQRDVEMMMDRIRPVHYEQRTEVLENVFATFYPAGHIAGAACIDLQMEEGTLFYSGDVSMFAQRTIDSALVPRLRPDVAICESTYGDRLHANREAEEKRLAALVAQHVALGHKVLIPCFALGRSQEVLLILKAAMGRKQIPLVPVYVDGMVRQICQVYESHPTYLRKSLAQRVMKGQKPFYSDNIRPVLNSENREELVKQEGAAIFVSSSGMLTGGPSVTYASQLASDENACIIITGYQDEESPGRALLNLVEKKDKTITLGGRTVEVKCSVEMVGLSAHGDQMELSSLMEKITPRHIILNHGSPGAIESLSQLMADDYRRRVYMPEDGETLEITLHAKRKQSDGKMPHIMEKGGTFDDLASYWNMNYPMRAMNIMEIMQVMDVREDPDAFAEKLLASGLFARDKRRLFLFRPKSNQEKEEDRKKLEPTPQDVEFIIRESYTAPIRRIGYYPAERKAVMAFDYPDALDQEMMEKAKEDLLAKTGWSLEAGPSVNFNAMALLVGKLCGNVKKASYYPERKTYVATVEPGSADIEQAKNAFYATTGWSLQIAGNEPQEPFAAALEAGDRWFPAGERPLMEQNALLRLVDEKFASSSIKPYKKGLMNGPAGKYLELSFTSPMLGMRARDVLGVIGRESGWRVHIGDRVNQSALAQEAMAIAAKRGRAFSKAPSYRSMDKSLAVDCEVDEDMAREFEERTGCRLVGR